MRELELERLSLDKEASGLDRNDPEMKVLIDKYQELSKTIEQNTQKFIETNKNSMYALFLFSADLFGKTIEDIETGYNKFSDKAKKSFFGEQIRTYLETEKNLVPGAVAPNFTQEDINGNIVTLEQFGGQPVVLVFWGSWCGPCRRSHPHLMELVNKYRGNIQFIGFASDRDKDKWVEAIEVDKLNFIHANLFDKYNGEDVQKMYNVRAFPTKVIIDKDGKIVKTIVGASDAQKAELEELLREATGK
jgi:thiol-disulfide isomerase/thioredoxin